MATQSAMRLGTWTDRFRPVVAASASDARAVLVVAVVVATAWADASRAASRDEAVAKNEPEGQIAAELQGTWQAIAGRQNGRAMQQPTLSRLAFVGNRFVLMEGEKRLEGRYTIDVSQRPKQLVLSSGPPGEAGETLRIAYSVEGGKLVLCFDPRPDAPVPRVLETNEGDKRILVTLESTLLRRFEGHAGPTQSAVFSPDGKFIVSGSGWPQGDRTIRLWDAASGRLIREFQTLPLPGKPGDVGPREVAGEVTVVAFAPDGKHVLSGRAGGFLELWDVLTGARVRQFEGHTGGVYSVAISCDGRRALSGSRDSSIRLWDLHNGKQLRRLDGHQSWVRAVAFSPDARRALSGGLDKTMRLWDLETGKQLRQIGEHEGSVWSVAFSPDGRCALSGADTIRLWNLEDGQEIRRMEGHRSSLTSVAFSPDGQRAVSCSYDGSVRLWDIETGRELSCFLGHENWVLSVAFSPDGRHVLSAGGGAQSNLPGTDFAMRLWKLP